MKQLKCLLFLSFVFIGTSIYAHEKTDTIKVSGGNCANCKLQIEKTVKVPGVTKAEWDAKTKQLIITYSSHEIRNIDIQKKLAEAGYDTEKEMATDENYNKLEACCKYRKK